MNQKKQNDLRTKFRISVDLVFSLLHTSIRGKIYAKSKTVVDIKFEKKILFFSSINYCTFKQVFYYKVLKKRRKI